MKKILSLMCALWACILMGFAMEVTVPGAVLDLQNPTTVTTAGWTGEIAYYLDNKVLVVSGNESYRSVGKQTWISQASVESTSATWSKESPFKGSDYYTTASAATVNNARNIAYLITGCDSIWCYGYNNSATNYLAMNIYDLTGAPVATIDDATATTAFVLDNAAAGGKASGIMKQALDASKTYLVELWGTGESNSRVFEMAFFRHQKASEMKTLYCKMEASWWTVDNAAIGAYAWGDEGTNADWPGVRMTAVTGQANLWKMDIDVAKYNKIIFTRMNPKDCTEDNCLNWGAKTKDLDIPTDDKNLFTIDETEVWGDPGCSGEWSKYEPSVTPPDDAKFYITGDAALVGDKAWNPAAIKVEADSYTFKNLAAGDYQMKVTVDGTWSTAKGYDDLTVKPEGVTKSTDGNICFTLAEKGNVTVTYTETVFTVEGKFSTTPTPPDDAKFYITGSANLVGDDKEWNPDAVKVTTDAYVFEGLAAGDYKLKVTVDGTWNTVKGYDELTIKPEGVTPDDDRNICFTLSEKSDVTVAYSSEAFVISGNFYVKPIDPTDKLTIRLVPGVWNKDGAKFACLTTNEGTAATVDITSLAASAVISDWFVGGDTVVGYIPADTKVIAFGRLNPATPELTIMYIMANLWNHSDILDLDESLIYTIDGWPEGEGDKPCPGHWGEGSVDPETKEISLVPGSWASDKAIFAAWAWPQGKEGTWSVFQGSGETLHANISSAADSILFVRFAENVTAPEWDANLIEYKTADFKIEDCGLFYFDDQTWCAPATPDENDFYITGDEALVGKDLAWNPAAIPVKGESYTFTNLPAGSYKLKVTVNGQWTTAKGYGDLTTVAENLSKDKSDNVCFTLGEAGDVVVTYTATVFTVAGKFVTPPEPQKVEIRLVPGVWNLDGAKFAAVTFTEMPAEMNAEALANAVISDWFVGVDTVVGLIPEDAKVIGFGRFNPETTELTLMNVMAEGTMWNHSDIMYIDESMIYTITGWPEEGKDVCPGYWGNNAGEGIEDIDASVKAVKIVHNGQVLILRGEHIYTVMGQEVK